MKKYLFLILATTTLFGFYFVFKSLPVNAQTKGIWIEAENETSSFIYPVSQRPAVNMKETKPSWRPPYFGSGDWYLASGGEYLTYNFSVPQSGKYNVWIRDYVDKFQPRGVRRIIVEFDDKKYGTFPEVNIPSEGAKGAFGWHKVGGGIELETGLHKMKITKEATTAGAAILDAFYLTLGDETPPKKSADEFIQETSIKYPIVELGNCENENACKAYCGKQENYAVCADFGEKNNLISKEDAAKAKEFADVLKGEGPGGCKDQKSCESYCNDISRINECVTFAEKHNFLTGDQLAEAKKVADAIKQGAVLPGGCKDKASCDNYCKDTAHIDECFAFAKKAGFISPEEATEAEKVLPLIKNGETPGQCKTKAECQDYCNNENNAIECINFAEKAGFATKEEADMARKTGGKGPGGCKSKESCELFCNKKENQKECFDFAKKYNLIPADKLKEIEDGMGRLRSGLSQMPPEAITCLKDNLGEGVVGEIESGNFTPGQDTGDVIKGCFDKILPQLQAKLQQGLQQATPETLTCLKSGLGDEGFNKIQGGEAPSPEKGDVLRKCFDSMKQEGLKKVREGLGKMPPEMKGCITEKVGGDTISKIEQGQEVEIGPEIGSIIQNCAAGVKEQLQQKIQQGLQSAPPEIRGCIESKLGNIGEKMNSGELKGESDVQKLIEECVSNFKPSGVPSGAGIPSGIPQGIPSGVPSDIPQDGGAAPAPDFGPGSEVCNAFSSVPSCSYVPANTRDICKQCKGE